MENKRRILIGGNWKSNNTLAQSRTLVTDTLNKLQFDNNKIQVVVAPISLHILDIQQHLTHKNVELCSQNVSITGMGAYTGELAATHLVDVGLAWTIVGHSERRQYYAENSEVVGKKTKVALDGGLNVISCIGENLEQRESNKTMDIVNQQLDAIIENVDIEQWNRVVIAYEPIWAIGTGKVATPQQAQEVHSYIRNHLKEKVGEQVGQSVRLLYGGSVNSKNCGDLIKLADVDGFLIGGASLKPEFMSIVDICGNVEK